MIKKKVGTITLAVGLIAAGLILFAQNFTPLPVKELYKYWPVLLIGLGLEMIVYMAIYGSRENSNVRVSLDGFCVFLIIVLALASNGVKFISMDNPFNFHFNSRANGTFYSSEYKTEYTKENVSASYSVKNLNITNDFGDIRVLKADGSSIRLEAKLRIKNNDTEKAKLYAKDAIQIKEGETTEISINDTLSGDDKKAYAKANVDFTIYVPMGVNVKVVDSFGDIDVKDIAGNLVANNQHGEITIENIGGNTNVATSFGNIEIKNIRGDLDASNQHGEITARDISGKASIVTSFGDIIAYNVGGSLDIRDSHGSVDIQDAKDSVQVKNSFGDINLESSIIDNAAVLARTTFGDIDCDNKPLTVNTSGQEKKAEGRLGTGQYKIDLITNNGNIDIK